MSVVASARYELLQLEAIQNIFGQNVFPVAVKSGDLPCIVVNQSEGRQLAVVYGGGSSIRDVDVTIDIYSSEYSDIETARQALIERFEGFQGVWNSESLDKISVESCRVGRTNELVDQADQEVYRCVVELELLIL